MKKRQKNKRWPSNIGRRTGVDVVQGKNIRRQDDGTEVFEDYWSDNVSVDSNQTIQLLHSPGKETSDKISKNVSILNRDSVSYRNEPRSSRKETFNKTSEEYEDHNAYVISEDLKKSEVFRKKLNFSEKIGRRTGINVVQGKKIRKLDDGTDVYDDYLTDYSNEVIQSSESPVKTGNDVILENGSVFKRDSVSFRKTRRSSMKENHSHGNGKFENNDSYFSSDQLNKQRVSRKISFCEDDENSAIGRSKMTQTSHLLDETETTPSKSRLHRSYKLRKSSMANSSDNKINSYVRKSSKMLLNSSQTPNRKENLTPSRDDTRADRISLLSKMASGKKNKDKRNSRVMTPTSHSLDETDGSPSRNRTYTSKSSSKQTGKDKIDSSDSEKSSVESSGDLSPVPNRREGLLQTPNDARASLSSKMESAIKAKNKHNSRVIKETFNILNETEDSPFKNRTYTPKTYTKETEENMADLSDSDKNSPVENSRVLSEISHESNRRKELSSSVGDTIAARISSSSKLEPEKTKFKRFSNVMTRASQSLNGKEGSPQKNIADSCDIERNSSVERYSGVLSESQNSKKKVKKRNSEKRLSQLSSKSLEVLNQKENITSKNDRSANKSEILVSGQKENDFNKRDQRKSSVGKSPIAIKRKMVQIAEALEGSPSKTPHVQNKSKENNFSGEKSHQDSDKSSKKLNSKRNIYSENENGGNKSGISVSYQKEDDKDENNQESPSGKSPKTSKSRKNFQENAPSGIQERRSTRFRRPPLASWRNERFKFVKVPGEKGYECVGVEEGQPEDDYVHRVLKKRYKSSKSKVQKPKIVSWDKRKKIPRNIKTTPIIDERTEKTVELYLHRPFTSYEWTLPPNEDNPGYMISRTFKSRFMTFGFLDIAGHSMKDKQHSPQDNLHFVVMKGVVEAVINTSSFTFEKGDSFIVPVGTIYSLSNETSKNALLSFTAFRIPFFTYQEND